MEVFKNNKVYNDNLFKLLDKINSNIKDAVTGYLKNISSNNSNDMPQVISNIVLLYYHIFEKFNKCTGKLMTIRENGTKMEQKPGDKYNTVWGLYIINMNDTNQIIKWKFAIDYIGEFMVIGIDDYRSKHFKAYDDGRQVPRKRKREYYGYNQYGQLFENGNYINTYNKNFKPIRFMNGDILSMQLNTSSQKLTFYRIIDDVYNLLGSFYVENEYTNKFKLGITSVSAWPDGTVTVRLLDFEIEPIK